MCELCEERFASVAPIVDDTLTMQMQYAQDHPERTQGQRVSDLANEFLIMLWPTGLPAAVDPESETVTGVKNIALLLAAMTERALDLKRVN